MPEMTREDESAMRYAFGAWMRLRQAIPQVEGEDEREALARFAEQLIERWQDDPWCEEWQYLNALVPGWQRHPETMRAVTAAAHAGGAELTDIEIRSLTQVWLLLDPNEAGRTGWARMQDRVSDLTGRVAAALRDDDLPNDVLDELEHRIDVLVDWSGQPAEWRDYDQHARDDDAFWQGQEQIFERAYQRAVAAAEA